MRLFGGGDEFITDIDLQKTSAGTNLLAGSKDWAANVAISGSAHLSDEKYLNGKIIALTGLGADNSLQIQNLSAGTQIAWSVWAKSTGTAILHTELNGGDGRKDIKLGSNWTRVFSHGAPQDPGVLFFWNNTPNSEIDLCLPKIELGSIATQWCPNYADYYDDLMPGFFHIETVDKTVKAQTIQYPIAAPTVEGYQFVFWLSSITVQWVGSTYIDTPTSSSANIWIAYPQNSDLDAKANGVNLVRGFAVYIKNPVAQQKGQIISKEAHNAQS